MSDEFLGIIEDDELKPINPNLHNQPNTIGHAFATNGLACNFINGSYGSVSKADCRSGEYNFFAYSNFDKSVLTSGSFAVHNPYNHNIYTEYKTNSINIKAGTTNINVAENGNVTITIADIEVMELTSTKINFKVPFNGVGTSTIDNKEISVIGGETTIISATTTLITTSGQQF